jgi:hypothetical protein
MITTMRHAFTAVLVLTACGPGMPEEPEDDDVPRDIYAAFDVRYPQGSTPDQVVLVWGLEVDGWCEAEAARQVADYGAAIVKECAPLDEMWCRAAAPKGCHRTEAACVAIGSGCDLVEL